MDLRTQLLPEGAGLRVCGGDGCRGAGARTVWRTRVAGGVSICPARGKEPRWCFVLWEDVVETVSDALSVLSSMAIELAAGTGVWEPLELRWGKGEISWTLLPSCCNRQRTAAPC